MQVVSERTVTEVRNELVTVRKAVLDFGRENVAGIKLSVISSVDRPVTVEVVEEFPGHFSMSDVQVHPGYNPEKWSISKSSRRMVFEDELAPWGEVETVYGVRVDPDNLEPLLDDPTIADTEVEGDENAGQQGSGSASPTAGSADESPASGASDAGEAPTRGRAHLDPESTESGGPVNENAEGGQPVSADSTPRSDAEGLTAPDAEPGAGPDREAAEPPSETEGRDPSADGSFVYMGDRFGGRETDRDVRTREEPTAYADGTDTGETPAAPDVVQAFVEAVSGGELSADQRAAIRDGLELGAERHEDVQLDNLQATVAKHAAFAEEFEAFVDAVGSPVAAMEEMYAAIERIDGTQAELRDHLDELSETVDAAAEDRVEIQDRLDEFATATQDVGDARSELRQHLNDLLAATRVVAENLDTFRDRLDRLERDLEARREERAAGLERLDERVSEIEAIFDTDEGAALREVIAAERRWRQRHDELQSGGAVSGSSGSSDR